MEASSTLDLILRIIKKGDGSTQAQKEIKALKSEVKEMAAGAALGLAALAAAYKVTVGATLDYASTVRDLSRNIGANADETSRLIQVADDYKITSDQLSSALEMATKRGFQPSIESLAELADQYKAIQDPVERARVLSEKFGKNWTTLTPLLEAGGDAIRSQSKAVNENLILTQEQIDQAREHELLVDNLTDTLQGYGLMLGNFVIPWLNKAIEGGENYVKVYQALWIKAQQMTGAISDEEAAMQAGILAGVDYSGTLENLNVHALAATASSRDHAAALGEVKIADDELRAAQELSTSVYDLATAAIRDSNIGLAQQIELEEQLALASGKLTAEEVAQKDAVGFLTKQLELGRITMDEYKAAVDELASGASTAGGIIRDVGAAIQGLPDSKTIHINIAYGAEPGPEAPVNIPDVDTGGPVPGGGGAFQHGTGGWLTVPPGFPNDSFRMGLSSGERVSVVPNTFNNSFNVGAPGVDVRALAREISTILSQQADARQRTR